VSSLVRLSFLASASLPRRCASRTSRRSMTRTAAWREVQHRSRVQLVEARSDPAARRRRHPDRATAW